MKLNALFLAALLPATCAAPLMAQDAQWNNPPPPGQGSGVSRQDTQSWNDPSRNDPSQEMGAQETGTPGHYTDDAQSVRSPGSDGQTQDNQPPYRRHPHPHHPPTDARFSASPTQDDPGCGCEADRADRGYPMPGQPVSRVIPNDIDNGQACDDMQETSPPPTHLAAYQVPEGTEVVICSGPGTPPGLNAGSPPPFRSLDTNGNGWLDESEASAYPPLANDFLYASHGKSTLNRASYERWASYVLRRDGGARDEAWQDRPANGNTDDN